MNFHQCRPILNKVKNFLVYSQHRPKRFSFEQSFSLSRVQILSVAAVYQRHLSVPSLRDRLRSKRAYHAMHWSCIHGLAASSVVQLRTTETKINAAPWALGKDFSFTVPTMDQTKTPAPSTCLRPRYGGYRLSIPVRPASANHPLQSQPDTRLIRQQRFLSDQ